jgi:hypothetical protein
MDAHHFEKLDPDPNQSKKQDPDPHQSGKVEALEGHFEELEGTNLEKSEWIRIRIHIRWKGRIRIRIRIRIKVNSRIRLVGVSKIIPCLPNVMVYKDSHQRDAVPQR